jgi:fructokinase
MLSFDPNIRPSLVPDRDKYISRFQKLCKITSVIKLSDEDLEWIFPDLTIDEAVTSLLKSGISLIALTTGKTGAWLINKTNKALSPIYDLPVSDTIGAGDTFHGALLSYLYNKDWLNRKTLENLEEDQLRGIGDFANIAAGINCSRSGANPPGSSEMEDALEKQHLLSI